MTINLSKLDKEIAELRKMRNEGERLSWAANIISQILEANLELDARILEVRVGAGLGSSEIG